MRVESVKTVATAEDVAKALTRAWRVLFEEDPLPESIAVLMAQSALETGRWKSCYSWGLGNVKWVQTTATDVCYRLCNELLTPAAAAAALSKASPRTDGQPGLNVEVRGMSGDKQIVWFYPDHPASAFRAFSTLDEGAVDYLGVLHRKFSSAWPAVVAGDPNTFVDKLKERGYFTAPKQEYVVAVRSLFAEYLRLLKSFETALPDVQVTPFSLSDLTWREIERDLRSHGLEEDGTEKELLPGVGYAGRGTEGEDAA